MSERDELALAIHESLEGNWFVGGYSRKQLINVLAPALIAAGFRRVGEDEVIVDRETVKLAVRWGEFVEDYGSDTAWTMTYDAPALKQMQDALGDADA